MPEITLGWNWLKYQGILRHYENHDHDSDKEEGESFQDVHVMTPSRRRAQSMEIGQRMQTYANKSIYAANNDSPKHAIVTTASRL